MESDRMRPKTTRRKTQEKSGQGAGRKSIVVQSPAVESMRNKSVDNRNIYPNCKAKGPYSDEWYTPQTLVRSLGKFDLDPCAGPCNHAVENVRPDDCGLSIKWRGRVWLNPPYRDVTKWLERMISHGNGILLVNARPETNWFQNTATYATALFLPKGRIKFERPNDAPKDPPVGSCLMAFGKRNALALSRCGLPGLFYWNEAPAPVPSVASVVTDAATPDKFIPVRNPLRPTPEP